MCRYVDGHPGSSVGRARSERLIGPERCALVYDSRGSHTTWWIRPGVKPGLTVRLSRIAWYHVVTVDDCETQSFTVTTRLLVCFDLARYEGRRGDKEMQPH